LATQTPNLGLFKAEPDDYVQDTLVQKFGQNWDVLDQRIVQLDNQIQSNQSTNVLAADVFVSGFVLSGMNASKDLTIANQLNVAAGVCYVGQSDGTLHRFIVNTTSFTTSLASSTYYLDFQPDGAYSWGTAHSAQFGYLPIAEVATDVNGNIATVADRRPLVPGVSKINADTVDGKHAGDLALATHVHDDRYYTENEVNAKLANKAELSHTHDDRYLSKTNSSSYVPTADYHPATKKYVDDNLSSAGYGDMLKAVYDPDNDGRVEQAENADTVDGLHASDFTLQSNFSSHTGDTAAHGATSTATANRIVLRDSAGRAKVAAPAAADDIARKDTVDAVQANLNSHTGAAAPHSGHVKGTVSLIVSSTAPSSPAVNDLWVDIS